MVNKKSLTSNHIVSILTMKGVTYVEKDINDYFREITQNLYLQVEERLAKYGLVKGQAQLLLMIRDNEGCTQKDLANYFHVKYSSMSERLNKLEDLGYIERSQDEDNLKYKRIQVTQEGKVAAVQCRRILKDIESKLFKGFSNKEITLFEKFLNRVVENSQK